MSERTPLATRLAERWEQFTPRERSLLLVMLGVLLSGVVLITTYTTWQKFSALQSENDARREILGQLLAQRDTFRARAEQSARVQEQLEDNDLRLSTFIESSATRAGMARPTDFTDREQQRDGNIVAMETSAMFPSVEMQQLTDLLNEVESTDELVFVQQVKVSPPRGRNAEGLQATITLVTYQKSE
jgi:type II secretory pathway component PulM